MSEPRELTNYEKLFVKRPHHIMDEHGRSQPVCQDCLVRLDDIYEMKCKCNDGYWVHESGTGRHWMWVPSIKSIYEVAKEKLFEMIHNGM